MMETKWLDFCFFRFSIPGPFLLVTVPLQEYPGPIWVRDPNIAGK